MFWLGLCVITLFNLVRLFVLDRFVGVVLISHVFFFCVFLFVVGIFVRACVESKHRHGVSGARKKMLLWILESSWIVQHAVVCSVFYFDVIGLWIFGTWKNNGIHWLCWFSIPIWNGRMGVDHKHVSNNFVCCSCVVCKLWFVVWFSQMYICSLFLFAGYCPSWLYSNTYAYRNDWHCY